MLTLLVLLYFLIIYFTDYPVVCYGSIILFIYGLLLSSKKFKFNNNGLLLVFRGLYCFLLPIINFLIFLTVIEGNANIGFTFTEFTTVQKFVFGLQVIFVVLPEILAFMHKKKIIRTNEKLEKLGVVLYLVLLILVSYMGIHSY